MNKRTKTLPRVGTWTNSNGVTFEITGIDPYARNRCAVGVRESWIKNGRDLPEVPTYTVTTVTGKVETYAHTKEEVANSTDEAAKSAWAQYEALQEEFNLECNIAFGKRLMLSVKIDPLNDAEWVKECTYLYGSLPDAPYRLMEDYFEDRVVRPGTSDATSLARAALLLGVVDEEVIKSIEKSFRDKV